MTMAPHRSRHLKKVAAFEVYLKSAGSYENAKKSERDLLVCDEIGFAETKELPLAYMW